MAVYLYKIKGWLCLLHILIEWSTVPNLKGFIEEDCDACQLATMMIGYYSSPDDSVDVAGLKVLIGVSIILFSTKYH